ncbi:PIG-L family deacetylase [Phenylobacterium sp.]|uniref:PIG-L deacetylase family protein n=1 Tax=Phenylobacterium sp. TaxID=1871053 RepID=UPI00281117A6|nr:PIG-L family deacetylase [Phenylobacterium sp.]
MNSALIVAAHPDDEVLGCGGTAARLSAEGWDVHILVMAEGATSRDPERRREARLAELSELERCAHEAGSIMGAASVALADFPDNRMDSVDLLDVVKRIEESIRLHQPKRVFTHSSKDVNIDHRVIHDAVIAATRPKPGASVHELFFFEVLSSTEWRPPSSIGPFAPTCFVDISDHIGTKTQALEVYTPELVPFPHPRSVEAVEALARYRGATVGVAAAEAFEVGRIII